MNILVYETKIAFMTGDKILPIDSTIVEINGKMYWRTDTTDSFHVPLNDVSCKVLLNKDYFKRIY